MKNSPLVIMNHSSSHRHYGSIVSGEFYSGYIGDFITGFDTSHLYEIRKAFENGDRAEKIIFLFRGKRPAVMGRSFRMHRSLFILPKIIRQQRNWK